MKFCPRCGSGFTEGSYCPEDGTPLARRTDALLGTTLLGQFEILAPLGRGAMGTVYQAWQPSMERPVAVKVLHADMARDTALVKRFLREARAVARLSHPNIVTVHVAGEIAGRPYLVMEYLEGETLEQALSGGPVGARRAVHIARQICSALADAHAAGIVHRDLKPANIQLLQRSRSSDFVKILDFGIAKIVDEAQLPPGESRLTREGAVFGTPHYIAPEQAAGGAIDQRADLYSVGVLLYRMISGRLPFEGSGFSVLLAHLGQEPPPLADEAPGVDPGLAEIVARCLAKDPERRFQSAEELADALDALRPAARPAAVAAGASTEEATARTAPVAAVSARLPRARRARGPLALALALLLAGGLAAAVYGSGRLAGEGRAVPAALGAYAGLEPAGPRPAADRPAAAPRRAVMVSQDGYSMRVLVPERMFAGVEHPIAIDLWDPDGEPLSAAHVVGVLVQPDGTERGVAAGPSALPGRFRLTRRFARSGSYVLRVLPPAGASALQVHFEVRDPDGPAS